MMDRYKRNRQIDEATAPHENPSPQWLLNEVAKALESGDPDASADTAAHLARRLEHKSVLTKLKTLKFLKFLCQHAPLLFRREAQKACAAPARALQMYRGPPDPTKGEALNRQVRELAAETVKSIYSEAPPEALNAGATQQSGNARIQGFGSSNMSGGLRSGAAEASGSGSKYGGFGSDGSSGGGARRGSGAAADIVSSATNVATSAMRMMGFKGAGGSQSQTSQGQQQGFGSQSQYEPYDPHPAPRVQAVPLPTPTNLAADAGRDEERTVATVCAPGGVRVAPKKEVLASAVRAALTQSETALTVAIDARLADAQGDGGGWQAALKALYFLEALLGAGEPTAGRYRTHYSANPQVLEALESSSQAQLRDKAKKVLAMLGLRAPPAAPTAARAAAAPTGSLIDFGGAEAAPAQPSAGGLDDLFGDMSFGGPAPETAASAGAPATQSAASPGADLFAGLAVDGSASSAAPARTPPAPATVTPAAPSSASAPLDADFFGGAAPPAPQIQQQQVPQMQYQQMPQMQQPQVPQMQYQQMPQMQQPQVPQMQYQQMPQMQYQQMPQMQYQQMPQMQQQYAHVPHMQYAQGQQQQRAQQAMGNGSSQRPAPMSKPSPKKTDAFSGLGW